MSHFIEDLRRVFPKKQLMLQTYMLGCIYLFHTSLDNQRNKNKKEILLLKGFNKMTLHEPHLKNFYNTRKPCTIKSSKYNSQGLLELKQHRKISVSDYQIQNPESFIHCLQIEGNREIQHFSLQELETIESDYISRLNVEESTEEIEQTIMVRSCIF